MSESKRVPELDIVKGLCIIFMVIGHTSWKYMYIFLLFHMAVFFMVSGYLFQDRYADSVKSVIGFAIKRLKRLYIPWVMANLAFLLCNNIFLKTGFLTSDPFFLEDGMMKSQFGIFGMMSFREWAIEEAKILFMGGGCTQFGGSLWFLRALLLVEVSFAVISLLAKQTNRFLRPVCIALMFVMGRILYGVSFGRLDIIRIVMLQVSVPISAYYFGFLCREYHGKIKAVYSNVGLLVSAIVLLIFNHYGIHNDLSNGTMTNPAGYVLSTLCGFVLCMSLAKNVLKLDKINRGLAYIGRNTMPILILHLLAFKIVTVIQISIYSGRTELPVYSLASFPTLFSFGIWPYLYTLVGVAVPLLVNDTYARIKKRLKVVFL